MDCNITNKEKRRGDVVNAKLANLVTSQVRLRPKSFLVCMTTEEAEESNLKAYTWQTASNAKKKEETERNCCLDHGGYYEVIFCLPCFFLVCQIRFVEKLLV